MSRQFVFREKQAASPALRDTPRISRMPAV